MKKHLIALLVSLAVMAVTAPIVDPFLNGWLSCMAWYIVLNEKKD